MGSSTQRSCLANRPSLFSTSFVCSTMGGSELSGLIAAIISALCNGSFAAVAKLDAVEKSDINPIVFNTYVSMGVFVSSFLVLPFLHFNPTFADNDNAGESFQFEPLGLIAGFLLVCAFTFSFLAIPKVGLSVGQGVWGGTAIVVSFVDGLIVGNSSIKNNLIIVALALLLTGVVGIAFCQELSMKLPLGCLGESKKRDSEEPLTDEAARDSKNYTTTEQDYEIMEDDNDNGNPPAIGASNFVIGMIFALIVGVCGGSILVPMTYVSDATSGLVFVPSLGIGAGIFSPLVPLIYLGATGELSKMSVADLHLGSCLVPGMIAGTIWNFGNVASIWAIPRMGYSVAYPIMQCALLVSALWGVFVFGEITDRKTIFVLFVSGLVLLGGAGVLSISVDSN